MTRIPFASAMVLTSARTLSAGTGWRSRSVMRRAGRSAKTTLRSAASARAVLTGPSSASAKSTARACGVVRAPAGCGAAAPALMNGAARRVVARSEYLVMPAPRLAERKLDARAGLRAEGGTSRRDIDERHSADALSHPNRSGHFARELVDDEARAARTENRPQQPYRVGRHRLHDRPRGLRSEEH